MVNRLPSWFFLVSGLVLIGLALLPLIRFAIGIDASINMPFSTLVMFLIAGLMSALTAMILLVRRQMSIRPQQPTKQVQNTQRLPLKLHSCGLLLFTGIPLLNFLVAYWLWIKHRHVSDELDRLGQSVLNFQITVYLYLLLSAFMVFAVIGAVTIPIILLLHLVATLLAMLAAVQGKNFTYPANIPITQGR